MVERFQPKSVRAIFKEQADYPSLLSKKAREITRKLVTRNYKLVGEFISPDALTKRLRECNVEIDFRDYVQSRVEVKS